MLWPELPAQPTQELTLDDFEKALDPGLPEMVVECSDCGKRHTYRLISDDPENWVQLEECATDA